MLNSFLPWSSCDAASAHDEFRAVPTIATHRPGQQAHHATRDIAAEPSLSSVLIFMSSSRHVSAVQEQLVSLCEAR